MEVELLISKVFERAPLWDKRDKQHANRNVIDKLWKEVSKELDCEGENIKYLLFMASGSQTGGRDPPGGRQMLLGGSRDDVKKI